jgi:hypothetical protein
MRSQNGTMVGKGVSLPAMSRSREKKSTARHTAIETIPIQLSVDEMSTLVDLSSYYGRLGGFVRRVIQVVSPAEMRDRARFVQEESYWLRRFAEANRDRMQVSGDSEAKVGFTPRSLVAFYGRSLGTLNMPRSRRRLSPAQIEQREALVEKLRSAVVALRVADDVLLEGELQTRRSRERAWIEEGLDRSARSGEADESSPGESTLPSAL